MKYGSKLPVLAMFFCTMTSIAILSIHGGASQASAAVGIIPRTGMSNKMDSTSLGKNREVMGDSFQ
jgi:hypothetical protein